MKSIFIGTRIEALKVLNLYTNLQLIFTTKNSYIDKYIDKNKFKIKYINKKNYKECFKVIVNSKCNFILSAGLPYIIPKKFLKKNKIIINLHPSLLPRYKGLKSVKDAIKNKEKVIGVTSHFINEKIDDGKIIFQKKIYIDYKNNIDSIYKILFSIVEPQVLKKTLERIIKI